jgi:hypothetical protein
VPVAAPPGCEPEARGFYGWALGLEELAKPPRYCLYADDGRARADIHHAPWPLQEAAGEVVLQTVVPVPLVGEPRLHHAGRLDVVIWPLERAVASAS